MKRILKVVVLVLILGIVLLCGAGAWYIHTKQPQRSGSVTLTGLAAPVTLRYDERGVPHIRAENETDMYRALGYAHAQDRLFQMEMVRRLARGELAEILGPKLLELDRLFRTLELHTHAKTYVAAMDKNSPTYRALDAYLDGVNQYQASHPAPLEFDLLGIPKRPFTPVDTMAVTGYMAYSFAAALKTDPSLTYVRDKLGPDYLRVFDLAWHPEGVLNVAAPAAAAPITASSPVAGLSGADWNSLGRIAALATQAQELAGVPNFEGSNAWVISGSRTASGKPLLAGDPHIAFAAPAIWWEAHVSAPGTELYGHYQVLSPVASLGHNPQFGWSLTMFQNDDMDLIAEKLNPANAHQVWYHGQWVNLQEREETIAVKGAAPVTLKLQRSPHGPIVSAALGEPAPATPVAMWWTFLETDNPVIEAFYELNRADTLPKARQAASKIHSPGLNVVWANAAGDIGWWASAKLVQRPANVNPNFILDGSTAESDKTGFAPFADNPHEENPPRGYLVSANHQPMPGSGAPVAGYYSTPDRARRLDDTVRLSPQKWTNAQSQALQLETGTEYPARVLQPILPTLREVVTDADQRRLLDALAAWDGRHPVESTQATLFNQLLYELARATFGENLGEAQFKNLLKTRALDHALPILMADAQSPWWDNRNTPAKETRTDTVKLAWQAAVAHLKKTLGDDPAAWTWGKAHTLTHNHPLGQQKPLDKLFSVGPMPAPGGREIPNFLGSAIGPAPWAVVLGPSTRRVIDFADASKAQGINPVGQSGVLFDAHYADQAADFIAGRSQTMHLSEADVAANTRSTLTLQPLR